MVTFVGVGLRTGKAKHKNLAVTTDGKVYFCDPQGPWQRGS